jgi:ATP/maltotriose-dependent transcriptional regulator MalT
MLAEAIYAQGRYDEVDQFIELSELSAGAEDVFTHALSCSVRAKLLVRRGDVAQGLTLGREAVDLADSSDSLHLQWYALVGYAEVLGAAGRASEAAATLRHAGRLAEQKGNLVAARLGQESLDHLVG